MFEALEPCCAQALAAARLNATMAAKEPVLMLAPRVVAKAAIVPEGV